MLLSSTHVKRNVGGHRKAKQGVVSSQLCHLFLNKWVGCVFCFFLDAISVLYFNNQ